MTGDGPLGLINRLVNRSIGQSETSRRELTALSGARLRVSIEGVGINLLLVAEPHNLSVGWDQDGPVQATVAGSPLALLGLLGERQPDAAALRKHGVRLDGDQDVASAFARLLRRARPDLEEELSLVVGDIAAHQVGSTVRAVGSFGDRVLATLRQNTSEFLQEESRVMPTRFEVGAFCTEVDTVRNAVERATARLALLEQRRFKDGD